MCVRVKILFSLCPCSVSEKKTIICITDLDDEQIKHIQSVPVYTVHGTVNITFSRRSTPITVLPFQPRTLNLFNENSREREH